MKVYDKFSLDFLWTMSELIARSESKPFDWYAYSVALFCLMQVGIPSSEVEESSQLFLDGLGAKDRESYLKVLERLIKGVSNYTYLQEALVSSLATVAVAQASKISDTQHDFMHGFQDMFDMKNSHFQQILQKGSEQAMALKFLAVKYAETQGLLK